MNPTKTILFLLISALVLALYPKPADAVYQCRGGNRNVENGVCRTTLYDDGVRCPDNKPSTSCFGFAVAPGGGGAPVDVAGDAATPVELSPTGPVEPPVPSQPQRIPGGKDALKNRDLPAEREEQSTGRAAEYKTEKGADETATRPVPTTDTDDTRGADANIGARGDPVPGIGITIKQAGTDKKKR